MSDPRVSTAGLIVSNTIADGDNPFVNFQTNPPEDPNNEKRHYFEVVAATIEVNRNLYEFTPEALEMLGEDFKKYVTLTINHEKGFFDNTLGYGATVDAVYMDGKLYVAAYISLDKTYPKGPFGNSEELRDGIIDGFINQVSQSVYPLKAKCSVCDLPYPVRYGEWSNDNYCRHYRGQQVIVEEDDDEKTVKTVHVIVEEAEAIELSLVQFGADRGNGIARKEINLSVDDFVDQERCEFLYGDDEHKKRMLESFKSQHPDNGGDPPQPNNNNPEGENKMSQETIQALTTRAETAEASVTSLRAEVDKEKGNVAVLTSQKTAVESQVSSLEAEKTALETQVEALTKERDLANEQLNTANASITEKNKEISTLKQEAAENEVSIADGKAAREEFEKEYVAAYVAAVGDDCSSEDEELQKETAKSFSIEVLKKKTQGFRKSAADNYPKGRNATESGKNPEGKENEDDEVYPMGV